MKTAISRGEDVHFTTPAGGVVSGVPVQIGQLLVVPKVTVTAAEVTADATIKFVGCTFGIFEVPKVSAQAWTEGQLIYWTGSTMTSTATGSLLCGSAAEVAVNPSAVGSVRLNGVALADES